MLSLSLIKEKSNTMIGPMTEINNFALDNSIRITMKIDFKQVEEQVLPKFKGGEKQLVAKMFTDEHNRIMKACLVPGASIGMHTHDTSSEIIFVLSGQGRAVCNGAEERLQAGDCHYCPKGSAHTFINDGDEDLIFFAVVPQQ
jgi:quercetin dioxygenase-like cupin family protein